MGNLYTTIQRRQDPRINILTKLKKEYRCNPRNQKEIDRLQTQLDNLRSKKKKKKNRRKPFKDSFGNTYYK